jgi:hypothetical protein
MITLTAEEVYDRLINVDKILTVKGQITFYLGGVDIIVKQKDVVGNIIQEWMEGWLKKNNIYFAPNPNTQMPPDVFLCPDDKTKDLMEVKAFNNCKTPGFDIADFKSYQQEIIDQPYMLHVRYLIFGYDMSDEGVVTIKRLWLKNVWEICRPSNQWAVNVQFKNGIVQKIRPAVWFSKSKAIKYLPFNCLEDYLSAIEETVYKNPDTRTNSIGWKDKMIKSYHKFYNKTLLIPRYYDIKDKYEITDTEKAK